MIARLRFGDGACPVDLRGLRVRPVDPSAPPGVADPGRLAGAALDAPLDRPGLESLARGHASATVVVPDATRYAALPQVLPAVLERLARAGVPVASTTVLVACGTHPPASGEEVAALVGPLPAGVSLHQHSSRDEGLLVPVGEAGPGRPVRLNRLAATAEFLVTVGAVRHHYFAGFGGGPKMVFPGVAGYAEIQANHSLVLQRTPEGLRRHPGCEPGRLEGNPVAEEIARAADLRPPDLCLCLVPGRDGRPAVAAAGPWRPAFAAAVERARGWYEAKEGPFRLMVVSGGGAPSDSTLIQAHKALDAACRFVEPGGEVLFVASLDGGAGSSEMEPFLEDPRPEAILGRLSGSWVQYGHTTLRLVEKTARFAVHLHSALDPLLAARLGFRPAPRPDEVVESWRERYPGETVGVMAGGTVYPRGPGDPTNDGD